MTASGSRVPTSQRRMVLSLEAEAGSPPSALKATRQTLSVCPRRTAIWLSEVVSHDRLLPAHFPPAHSSHGADTDPADVAIRLPSELYATRGWRSSGDAGVVGEVLVRPTALGQEDDL